MAQIGIHYESQRLINAYEEQDYQKYKCPLCGYEAEVAVTFDIASGYFYPDRIVDAICPVDEIEMDRA